MKTKFALGLTVFHSCAVDQLPGLVTAVIWRIDTITPRYEVAWGDGSVGEHAEIELALTFVPKF